MLNLNLLDKQKVNYRTALQIAKLHYQQSELILALHYAETPTPSTIGYFTSTYAKLVQIEFDLQKLWKFTEDSKFHRLVGYIPHCLCSAMDNDERVGYTDTRIYNERCPIHCPETAFVEQESK